MDKYDKFLADVIEKTREGTVTWDVVSPTRFNDFTFQAPFVYSSYEAGYKIGAKKYILGFIEKKMPSTANDMDIVTEQYRCEMVVIENNKLIFTLTDQYVDYDSLIELGSLLESKNTSAEDLFKNFE